MVGFYLIISISMNVFTISVRIPIEAALLINKKVFSNEMMKKDILFGIIVLIWNWKLCKSDDNIFGFENYEMDYLYDFFSNPIDKNKEYAIKNGLLLCYKFRNNLFHGKKDIYALEKYNEDF